MTLEEIFNNASKDNPIKSSGGTFIFEFCKEAFKSGFTDEKCYQFLKDQGIKKFSLKLIKDKFKRTQEFHDKKVSSDALRDLTQIERFERMMHQEYEFYHDIIKDADFIRNKTSKNEPLKQFERLNDRHVCSIWRENMKKYKPNLSLHRIELIFKSDFFPKSSGLHRFRDDLPKYDGEDHIGIISSSVKTNNDKVFKDRFLRWFVAMVGTAYTDMTNDLVLILSGEQGVGKTRFFKKLFPGILSEYYVAKLPRMRDKDTEIMMAEHLNITIDEIDALSFGDNTSFKELITTQKVSVRKPYDKKQEEFKKYASFSGTTNRDTFLTDTTGSRRFLCFKVFSVDLSLDFPIEGAFAQALHLIDNGYQHWLDKDDIIQQEKLNEEFRFIEPEEDMLLTFTSIPDESSSELDICYFSSTILLQKLLKLADANKNNSPTSVKRLGSALTKHGYKRVSKNGRKVYELIMLQTDLPPISERDITY